VKKYIKVKAKRIPLYRGYLVIILSNSQKRVRKIIPEFHEPYIYAHSYFSNYKNRQGFFMILDPLAKYRAIKSGVVAHEAVHLASMIAYRRGFEPDFNNDEPLAYLTEWIVDFAHQTIKKNGWVI